MQSLEKERNIKKRIRAEYLIKLTIQMKVIIYL